MSAERSTAENAEERGGENELDALGERIIGAAINVHRQIGPGLLESAYEACLSHELGARGLNVGRQVALPIRYNGVLLEAGYRIDLLVEDRVVLELKTVERILPLHLAQTLSYLKLGDYRLGYILNFHVERLRDGIRRVVNGL